MATNIKGQNISATFDRITLREEITDPANNMGADASAVNIEVQQMDGGTTAASSLNLSTNRLGVNVAAPTEALDVSGNIKVSGTVDGADIADIDSKVDQDVTSGSTPTFTGTNFTGIPSAGLSTVAIAQGGTGQTTRQAALDALTDTASGSTNQVLTRNGSSNAVWSALGGAMDNPFTTEGDLVYSDSSGDPQRLAAGVANYILTSNGTGAAPSWQAAAAGFTDPMTTKGDLIYRSGGGTARLAKGTTGQLLRSTDGSGPGLEWFSPTYLTAETNDLSATYTPPGGGFPANHGGTGHTSYTAGDLLRATGATALSKLGIGTAGQVLTVNAGATDLEWSDTAQTGHTIHDEAGALTQTQILNFTGAGVTATHNGANNRTDITIPGAGQVLSLGAVDQIPVMNSGGTDFDYSAKFKFHDANARLSIKNDYSNVSGLKTMLELENHSSNGGAGAALDFIMEENSGGFISGRFSTLKEASGSKLLIETSPGGTSGSWVDAGATTTNAFAIGPDGNVSIKNSGNIVNTRALYVNGDIQATGDIITSDLVLNNSHLSEGNSVDGTKGSWVIQEGEDDLFIINKKNGKKYKFALTEV
tara:strand:- start:303 stop:2072 length:1770 start_codon:yes stop_codon:yes gene_type:complete